MVQRGAAASTTDSDAPLAERLRSRRRELGLTLKEVAEQTSLSVGFISQIERGLAMPSISSLVGVARVLEVNVSHFLTQPKATAPTTRQSDRLHYAVGSSSVTYERISSSFPGNILSSVLIHEPPGHRSEPIAHEGEELFFVIDGALTVEVEGEHFVLTRGDSLHFASSRIHSAWNHTPLPATVLHTCTMDVFGDKTLTDNDASQPGRVGKKTGTTKSKGSKS